MLSESLSEIFNANLLSVCVCGCVCVCVGGE